MPLYLPANSWYPKPSISPFCVDALFMNFRSAATNIGAGVLANTIVYLYPFRVSIPYPITYFWWVNGATVNGNVDMGVYSEDGQTLLVSAGSTAQSGASAVQTKAVSFTLSPGRYYLGFATSSATATFHRQNNSVASTRAAGFRQHTTSAGANVPLPTTLIFAAHNTTANPFVGMTRLALI